MLQQANHTIVMCVWNGIVVFVSLFFLTGAFFKSVVIAAFVLVSSLLGYGQRFLLPAGFALAMFAIAVAFGVIPHPNQWDKLFGEMRAFLPLGFPPL